MECLATSAVLVALGVAVAAYLRTRSLGEALDRLILQNEVLSGVIARLEARVAALEPPAAPTAGEAVSGTGEAVSAAAVEQTSVAAAPRPVPRPAPVPSQPAAMPTQAVPVPPVPSPAPPIPLRPGASLEERLGARVFVWVGSIAFALAGAFLVKYSFDQGWLSPAVRVALGVIFGVLLLALGEAMRRSSPVISQGLSAAGIADLFACFLAAVHLYHLISPAVGFAFMALTALVAVLLSLRQGVMVALIGLAGGFLTPALIRAGEPNVRNLFGYLLVLTAAVVAVSWRQRWGWVTGLALVGGLLWVLVWLGGPFRPADAPWLSLFLVCAAAAAVVTDLGQRRPSAAPDNALDAALPGGWLSWGTLTAALAVLGMVTGASGYSAVEWAFLGLLSTATLVLARLRPPYPGLAWIAAAMPAVLLAAWGGALEEPERVRFLWTALVFGSLLAGGAYLAHRGARHPGRWAALSATSALVFFLIAWASSEGTEGAALPWGALALAAAVLFLIAALPVARRRRVQPEAEAPLAALAVAVTVFASLAAPLELERQWLTVAWASEVAALTWLAGRFRLPALITLARLLALVVAVRLLVNPEVFNYPIGEHPVFNWLLYGYGIPLAAFAAAAWLARRQGWEPMARELEAGTLIFAFALVTLLVRQWYHPGEPGRIESGLAEVGTLAIAWSLLGWGVLASNRRLGLSSFETGGRAFLLLGAAAALLGAGLVQNPLWTHQAVGEAPVFNLLLWAYGLPAALLVLAVRELRRREGSQLPHLFASAALLLAFVLVSLEVRQAFHGTFLDAGTTTAAERYSYSAAWVLFAILLLVAGVVSRGRVLRYASLAVMMLAVGKVFLYDAGHLSDLYRVFSFLGLGASLLLLAWVYQRFVFRETP